MIKRLMVSLGAALCSVAVGATAATAVGAAVIGILGVTLAFRMVRRAFS